MLVLHIVLLSILDGLLFGGIDIGLGRITITSELPRASGL